MKQIIAILFLSVFTLTSTELIQLLKLPSLIEHFTEHKAENGTLSVSEFFALHYSDESHHHDENDEHLPFKSHDHCLNGQVAYVWTKTFTEIKLKQDFEAIREFTVPKGSILVTTNPSAIWQPPKIS